MKTRIVWNLTNDCPFNCTICAASANLRKEECINKEKILESILTIGENNILIDFSGGDPLMNKDDIYLIKKVAKIIGNENISISTTGLSLTKLTDQEILELSQNYDLTYDFPVKYNNLDERDKKYNYENFKQGKRINKLGLDLNIFIPLKNMDEYLINELVKDLIELNPKTISVIRLMPVGKLLNKKPINFDESKAYNTLKSKLLEHNYNGIIKATCSLRTIIKDEKGCNMINDKYGIDPQGNLYSCIWAADILNKENPFILGNLLKTDMNSLISSIDTNFNKNDCAVYQYIKKQIKN